MCKMLSTYLLKKHILKICSKCFGNVFNIFSKYFQNIFKIFSTCFQNILKTCWKCFQNIKKKIKKTYFQNSSKTFWNYTTFWSYLLDASKVMKRIGGQLFAIQAHVHSVSVWKLSLILSGACIVPVLRPLMHDYIGGGMQCTSAHEW